jgi:triosephosphate isomerase
MRNFLVAGNWKMHGDAASNRELVAGILEGAAAAENVSLLVCPPFPYLSPAMLRDVGCRYAIVGHSERRTLYGETSAQVAEKMAAALGAGLMPILCIGETLSERESGSTEQVVGEQLAAAVERNGIAAFGSSVVAYEPVWAIGTGKTATPEQAQDVHRYIRSVLAGHDASVAENVQILYGGSVKGDNAAGLFGMPDIDGGLIGGASLKPADFLAIARAATEI